MTDTSSGNQQSDKKPYVVLALQGGGALGAFQAGAYQALREQYEPNWVAGISIGAINASIIAGNDPKDRVNNLKKFWHTAAGHLDWWERVPSYSERFTNLWKLWMSMAGGVPGFFRPNFIPPPFAPRNSPQASSLYNVERLKTTLQRLINFDLLKESPEHVRLSLGATRVFGGVAEVFQNFDCPKPGELPDLECQHVEAIKVEHILASGANAPWFPGQFIDKQLYWDGGFSSNTAVRHIIPQLKHLRKKELGDRPVVIFAIDLWGVYDRLPRTFEEVCWRIKQIQYSSRFQHDVTHGKHFLEREPRTRPVDIVRVCHRCDPSEIPYGDGLFSRTEIERRIEDGYAAVLSVFEQEQPPWQREDSDDNEVKIHSF